MTLLEAVNQMIQAIGMRPVTTYTASDGSQAAIAAGLVADYNRRIQARGWHCNTETDVELPPPDTAIVYVDPPTGTFLAGETVTETTSGATGRFGYLYDGSVYLTELDDTTAAFTGGQVLTGAVSGATVTGTTAATVTEGFIYMDADVLSADPVSTGQPDVTNRGGRFYNITDNTFTFDAVLTVQQVRLLAFTQLPPTMADLVTVEATLAFCTNQHMPVPDDIKTRLGEVRMRAAQEDGDRADLNLMDSDYFRSAMGRSGSMPRMR